MTTHTHMYTHTCTHTRTCTHIQTHSDDSIPSLQDILDDNTCDLHNTIAALTQRQVQCFPYEGERKGEGGREGQNLNTYSQVGLRVRFDKEGLKGVINRHADFPKSVVVFNKASLTLCTELTGKEATWGSVIPPSPLPHL